MNEEDIAKPIRIWWITPSGEEYNDVINMTQKQYENFLNNLINLKKENNKK